MSLITENTVVANGGTTYNFTFKYVKESDVYVSVDDAVKTKDTHYTFAPNTSSITFLAGHIPQAPAKVRIFRETDLVDPAAEFFPGSAIRAQDLNANNDQVLFSAQERKERSLDTTGGTITGSVTVNGDVIFEGLTEDANETTLTVVDPTQDNTITLPNASGHVPLLAATSTTQISVTPADINKVGPVTDGTVTASKAVVVDANKDITGLRNVTMSGNLDVDATANLDAVDIDDNVDLGANLNFTGSARVISAVDNNATALTVTDGADTYLTFDTTTGADKVVTNKTLNVAGNLEIAGSQVNSSATDLNIVQNMTKGTTLTSSSDTQFPTSKAVADYVTNELAAIDGFVAVAVPTDIPGATGTAVPAGVTISIADAGALPVDSNGQAQFSNIGTVNNVSGQVTITGIAAPFRPAGSNPLGVSAGVRFLIEGTGTAGVYTYHKATLKEQDLINLSTDIQDFGERYRVFNSGRTLDSDTSNHSGDLCFDVPAEKMFVYNAPSGVAGSGSWGEVQSVGDFILIPDSELTNFTSATPTNTATISNPPAVAQQIMLVINGVVQKASTGTGAPAEGFTLGSGGLITLSTAPPANSTCFGIILGSSVNVGVVGAGSVNTLQLANDSVDNDKLDSTTGSEAVNTNVIRDGAINADKIQDDQVTEPKLATTSAGTTGQYLQKTGATTMNWASVDTNLVSDTTPQLGGDLDVNNHDIVSTGNTNIVLDPAGTGQVEVKSNIEVMCASSALNTLTDAATIAVDLSLANNHTVTLGGNRTLGNPTNAMPGQTGSIFIVQDGTGGRTLTPDTNWHFAKGGAHPTFSTAANAVDRIDYIVRTPTSIHCVATFNYS